MSKEIVIYNIPSIPKVREDITKRENVDKLLSNINDLNNVILNFDSPESIKESKQFKTHANKFIKEFKEFCDPLEEEGKFIAKTRSEIKLKLEKIVNDKLQPISERENNLKKLKDRLFIPSLNIEACKNKLSELDQLNNYDWFGLKDEALPIINQSKTFLQNELIGFEKAEQERIELEEKARIEREQAIRLEAENRAKEQAQKAIDEANKRAEIAEQKAQEITKPEVKQVIANSNIEHQRKIHNEILEALIKLPCQSDCNFAIDMKFIIKAIAKGEIPHLFIKY